MNTEFSGIWPILYSFFKEDGNLDRTSMRCQVQACLTQNILGLAVLGLATEVHKLTSDEQLKILKWAVEDLQGRLPLAVTVSGPDASTQLQFAKKASDLGANWLILQPPSRRPLSEEECFEHFSEVMNSIQLPIAIQNAPEYLGVGLSIPKIVELNQRHSHFKLLKGEGSAVEVEQLVKALKSRMQIFNGRGGIEQVDSLRAGCAGLILAPELVDRQVKIYQFWRDGLTDEAEVLQKEILPMIVFNMQTIPHLLCYGKRLLASRLGLTVFDRAPFQGPSVFGLKRIAEFAKNLGPLSTR
ncbi:MAG: dihydrodipicolinate synthase family protein [Deltaproteobacteria bacterium]|jgi:2-keto-3-deoxy-L-arabinonate dehydratase|nr:dihydrodipicolinate synthase family protein [Deltaproteobacteria bacterium]MBT7205359.1 dihydrodipicolinate synthase family protein [Deltaproteobacteria bacterium]